MLLYFCLNCFGIGRLMDKGLSQNVSAEFLIELQVVVSVMIRVCTVLMLYC